MFRYLLSVISLLIICLPGRSQTTITIGTGPTLTADYQSGPIYRSSSTSTYDYSQYAYLYNAAELSGISSGSAISKIAWNKLNTGATTGGGSLKIYLKNSTATGYTVATAFSSLISNATLVYDNSQVSLPATAGYQEFILTTPFTYIGGGLEIMVDWDISGVAGNPSTAAFNWEKTTVESAILGYASGVPVTAPLSPINNSIGDITNTRPVVRLSFGPPLSPCSGIPAGGNISVVDSICSGIGFSLLVTGATTGVSGLSYQWQSSADSLAWTDIAGGTSETFTLSQTLNTYYRRLIRCGINADTSTAKLVRLKMASSCICLPDPSNCSLNDFISHISFGTINNTSACSPNGYIDYSGTVAATDLIQGEAMNIAVTVGSGGTEFVAAWIDFNQNGIFETNEYSFIGSGSGITLGNTINVPDNIPSGLTKMRIRLRYNGNLPATDNCANISYGETEDYAVNILTPVPCSGTPAGGTTVADALTVCNADSVVLTVSNSSTGVSGLSYQWEASPDNTAFFALPGKTGSSCFVYQSTPTWYRRKISCGGSFSYSTALLVGITSGNLCYCRPDSSNCSVTADITNVHFAAINNSSNCSFHGYGNYTATVPAAAVQAGVTLPVSISAYSVSSSLTNYFIVWIDYDHNGIFDSSEHSFLGAVQGTGTISGSIHIPASALTGITGMRVRAKFNSPAITGLDACTAFGTSETEDYLVTILPASSCTNGLTAGTISGPVDACPGFDFMLTGINTTVDPSVRYAWQSSPDSLNWTNLNNTATVREQVTTFQTATTWYRLVDSCSTATAISNVIKVLVRSDILTCHCVPPGSSVCTIGDIIGRVQFGTIDTTTYCSPNGYGNFVNGNQTTTITANSYASMSVQVGCATGSPENVAVWIDFNHNGVFEASEFTYLGHGCGSTITGNISIPTNAQAGAVRLRIRVTADGMMGPGDACTHYANGETEDYKVNISPYSCPVNSWTGAANNVWENPLNWGCGTIPGIHSNVVINSGNPVIASNVNVYSLDVNASANLTVSTGYNLTVTH